jgi:hypothetical protein
MIRNISVAARAGDCGIPYRRARRSWSLPNTDTAGEADDAGQHARQRVRDEQLSHRGMLTLAITFTDMAVRPAPPLET